MTGNGGGGGGGGGGVKEYLHQLNNLAHLAQGLQTPSLMNLCVS